jgi:PleD family two-component response regulator
MRIHHPRSAVLRYISISVGVCAVVPEEGDSPASLLERAQRQLQTAKQAGRNQAA